MEQQPTVTITLDLQAHGAAVRFDGFKSLDLVLCAIDMAKLAVQDLRQQQRAQALQAHAMQAQQDHLIRQKILRG